jgi:hypothetical protein
MLVICPSRGRPDAASELQKTFLATRQDERSQLVFAIDSDDVALEGYAQHARGLTIHVGPGVRVDERGPERAAHALLHADHDVDRGRLRRRRPPVPNGRLGRRYRQSLGRPPRRRIRRR